MKVRVIASGTISNKPSLLQVTVAGIFSVYLLTQAIALVSYNLPNNLIDPYVGRITDAYVLPYFGQAWNLFAPTPGGVALDYRFHYRFSYANRSANTTAYLRGNDVFAPSLGRSPFSSLEQFREVSYACMTMAEDGVAQSKRRTNYEFPTVTATSVDAATSCLARLTLGLADEIRPALSSVQELPISTAVQISFILIPAVRVADFYYPSRKNKQPSEQKVFTSPWIVSSPVQPYLDGLEITERNGPR